MILQKITDTSQKDPNAIFESISLCLLLQWRQRIAVAMAAEVMAIPLDYFHSSSRSKQKDEATTPKFKQYLTRRRYTR
jgi:hypothetical protein